MDWFYVSETRERRKFREGDIAGLVRSRVLRPETMVWKKGMDDWISGSEIHPEWFRFESGDKGAAAAMVAAVETAQVKALGGKLSERAGWMRTLAALTVALGVPTSIFGGVILIVAGAKFFGAVGDIEQAALLGQKSALTEGLDRLGSAARLAVIGIATVVVVFLVLWGVFEIAGWSWDGLVSRVRG